MLDNLLREFQSLLRGKNGWLFLLVLGLFAVYIFFKIIPFLLQMGLFVAGAFIIFKFLEKK